MSKLYVRKPMRKKGHGRVMVHWIEEWARAHGCLKISLTVNKHNAGSIQAYRKMGFVVVSAMVMDIGGGFVMDDFRMEKAVGL